MREKTIKTCTSHSDVRYEERTKKIGGKAIKYWEPVALVGEKRKPRKTPAAKKPKKPKTPAAKRGKR
jgi:hypothetical protein